LAIKKSQLEVINFISNFVKHRLTNKKKPATRLLFCRRAWRLFLVALEIFERHNAALIMRAPFASRFSPRWRCSRKHPRVELLFLGTSRTQDGVSPDLGHAGIETIAPENWATFRVQRGVHGIKPGRADVAVPRFGYPERFAASWSSTSDAKFQRSRTVGTSRPNASVTLEDKLGDWSHKFISSGIAGFADRQSGTPGRRC